MTSDAPRGIRAGDVVTALVVAVCVVILAGLGVWQVKRLHWKEDLLRRVAAAQVATPQPLKPVLQRADGGEDVEWTRVSARCGQIEEGSTGQRPEETRLRYSIKDGEIAWRARGVCWFEPSWGIPLDRGVIKSAFGKTEEPRNVTLPAPQNVVGVLRRDDDRNAKGSGRRILVLVVEHETPQPQDLAPAPYPTSIPNNHLGYAITWFGLALALIGVYGSALAKRRRGR